MTKKITPFGSWHSPLSAKQLAAAAVAFGQVRCTADTVYWTEMRPDEQGRNAFMRCHTGHAPEECLPGFNVRSRVHEYGGGAFAVDRDIWVVNNDSDHGVYVIEGDKPPRQIASSNPDRRYTDFVIDQIRNRIICVCEDHGSGNIYPNNRLVVLEIHKPDGEGVLVSGADFYASAALSPDGSQLAWLSWNFPNMPWDGTDLWLADIDADGALTNTKKIAGGAMESIFQPQWSPGGELFFVSDRSGWWNIYCYRTDKDVAVYTKNAEFGLPQWVFGMSTYGFIGASRLFCSYTEDGKWYLDTVDLKTKEVSHIDSAYTDISNISTCHDSLYFIGASSVLGAAICRYELMSKKFTNIYCPAASTLDQTSISVAQAVQYPTADGSMVHAFYYPPCNSNYTGPRDALPPLLVKSHGGPTAATSSKLNNKIQFWTSRGFAVLDVNYRGSTGYGRDYRMRLNGHWGLADVEDCVAGARFLVDSGWVDKNKMAISGSSAGGYTTLCALIFSDVFGAGASYYGIGNLEDLVKDTHKFEAHYLDTLVGPYPQALEKYHNRSPVNYADRLSRPVIFFQGGKDKVVPPAQAENMVQILRNKKLPVAYIFFSNEQHGFRNAKNIERALESEYYFYTKVFGFTCADEIEPYKIENL